jgi:very-short-patch-repair endonuclease
MSLAPSYEGERMIKIPQSGITKITHASPKDRGVEVMARIYNKKKFQERRRMLRNNMLKSEVVLWSKIKNRQIHGERFLRQYDVDQYVLDFYCPRLKLAIEVDGDSDFMPGSEGQDKARQEYIETLGIHFMRFTNVDIL